MDKSLGTLGRAILVTGVAPALLWLAFNIAIFWQSDPLSEQILSLTNIASLAVGVGVGILLFALDGHIIHLYEGVYGFQRRWLLKWAQQRNERRHAELYGQVLNLRQMEATAHDGPSTNGVTPDEAQRRAASVYLALDEAHGQLEQRHVLRTLPIRKDFVKPTALGNVYAVIEEYPYERYGMDSMVFWPRLTAVLPVSYRDAIGGQKITCDFLMNTSLVLSILALETAVALLLGPNIQRIIISANLQGLLGANLGWGLLALTIFNIAVSYGLYRALVTETMVLGHLIDGAFDLYRHDLMRQFGLTLPTRMADEQRAWRGLAAFIRRGEAFYYPGLGSVYVPAEEQPTDQAGT